MCCYVFLSDEFHSRDLSINNINFIITHCRLNHTAPGFLDGRTSTCLFCFHYLSCCSFPIVYIVFMPTFLLYTANVYLIIYMHMCLNLVVARSTVHVHAFTIQSLICAAQQFGEGVTSIS